MVSKEYAKAIFEIALENNKEENYLELLKMVLKTLDNNVDFKKTLNSPFISSDKKIELLNNVYFDFDEDFFHFLFVLVKNNRFNLIYDIKDEFEKLYHENINVIFVRVTSAQKLSKKQEEMIRKDLEAKYPGVSLNIKNEIDPNIIGGIKIMINDESIDLSLRNYLSKLKESI